jgi:hypothetical protein
MTPGPMFHAMRPRAGTTKAAGAAGWTRPAVVTVVLLLIALVHLLRVGTLLHGAWFRLYHAYASDILLPFGAYFLLCARDGRSPLLADRRAKALVALGAPSLAETLQAFGVPALGRTFDRLDQAMYAGGVAIAVAADRFVLVRALPGWSRARTT